MTVELCCLTIQIKLNMVKSKPDEYKDSFWLKVAGGILTSGIVAIVSISYKTTTQLAVMQTDVTYVRDSLKSFDSRLSRLENSTFTGKDAEQLKTWTELKLEALRIRLNELESRTDNIGRSNNVK